MFLPPGFAGSAGTGGKAGRAAEATSVRAGCKAWSTWQALFGLRTQCRCALLRPPAVADSCPAFAGQSCQRKGFPDFWGKKYRGPHMPAGRPFLNARRASSAGRTVCLAQMGLHALRETARKGFPDTWGENIKGLRATEQGPALRLYADGKNMVSDTKEPFPPCAVIFPECVP